MKRPGVVQHKLRIFTPDTVREIRRRYAELPRYDGEYNPNKPSPRRPGKTYHFKGTDRVLPGRLTALAKEFGCARSSLIAICKRETYTDVD